MIHARSSSTRVATNVHCCFRHSVVRWLVFQMIDVPRSHTSQVHQHHYAIIDDIASERLRTCPSTPSTDVLGRRERCTFGDVVASSPCSASAGAEPFALSLPILEYVCVTSSILSTALTLDKQLTVSILRTSQVSQVAWLWGIGSQPCSVQNP